MKILIDIETLGEPRENDVIVFRDGKWKVISKESFFARNVNEQRAINNGYEKRIEKLEKDLVALAKIVKEK